MFRVLTGTPMAIRIYSLTAFSILAQIVLSFLHTLKPEELGLHVICGAIVILLNVGWATIIQKSIIPNLNALKSAMQYLAEGGLEIAIPSQSQKDEIGAMARVVQIFKENALKLKQMTSEREETVRRSQEDVRNAMLRMSDDLDGQVQDTVAIVVDCADRMKAGAEEMRSVIERMNTEAGEVADAGSSATENVERVAAASEQLAASIEQIAASAGKSALTAQTASTDTGRASQIVQKLAESATKIGEVTNLISQIAEQTNLLALNATIEAARAGEAGRGFAVVANEVKSLANQTARATDDISTQIAAIQAETREAVDAIGEVARIIGELDAIAGETAGAMEQQRRATSEISQNAQSAVQGTRIVSGLIDQVSQESDACGRRSKDLSASSAEVAHLMGSLRKSLTTILRKSSAGNRREHERLHVDIPARLVGGSGPSECRIVDLSAGGAGAIVADAIVAGDLPSGKAVTISTSEFGELPGMVRSTQPDGRTGIQFQLNDKQAAIVQEYLDRMAPGGGDRMKSAA